MAGRQAEYTTNPMGAAAALSEGTSKRDRTVVREGGEGEGCDELTSLHESLNAWSLYTSLLKSDDSLKKETLFVQTVTLLASFHVLWCKIRKDSAEPSSVDVLDIWAAFPLSKAVRCRLKKLFIIQDIDSWLKCIPRTVEVDEVIDVVFVLVERQLNMVAEVESLKSRKDAFAVLLEEKKQWLEEEQRKNEKGELEKAKLSELNRKLCREVDHLRKVVADLTEQIEVLLGDLEHSKKDVVAEVKEVEISAQKEKWELERQELVLRVSELKAALVQQGAKEEHLVLIDTEAKGAVRPTDSALEEELARVQKELSGSKEKSAILIEMYKESKSTIEELLMENAKLKAELSAVKMQQEIGKTYDMSTLLKENANLRAALKTVEHMKMELENEKVAVQDQLLEYQRRCGVFNKPLPVSTAYTTASNRAAEGKMRASTDGVVKATVAPSVRACPFCKREFGQLQCNERQFMDHINNCQGLTASELHDHK